MPLSDERIAALEALLRRWIEAALIRNNPWPQYRQPDNDVALVGDTLKALEVDGDATAE